MKKFTEHKRKRREYLMRKAELTVKQDVAAGSLFLALFVSLVSNALSGYIFLMTLLTGPSSWKLSEWRDTFPLLFLLFGICAVSTLLARRLWRASKQVEKERDALAYVPPLKAETLPVEEVLVRGTEAPDVHDTLLRAAKDTGEAKPEELLRPTQGRSV